MNALKEEALGPLFDAPFVRHSATSREAAEFIAEDAPTLRKRVFECIKTSGAQGMTDEELQYFCNMDGSTERPRRRELEIAGLVIDSGLTRKTRSGRAATVWRIKP